MRAERANPYKSAPQAKKKLGRKWLISDENEAKVGRETAKADAKRRTIDPRVASRLLCLLLVLELELELELLLPVTPAALLSLFLRA